MQFDGSFNIERLPVGHSYLIYAEPLTGVATPDDFSGALDDLCTAATPSCITSGGEHEFQSAVPTLAAIALRGAMSRQNALARKSKTRLPGGTGAAQGYSGRKMGRFIASA